MPEFSFSLSRATAEVALAIGFEAPKPRQPQISFRGEGISLPVPDDRQVVMIYAIAGGPNIVRFSATEVFVRVNVNDMEFGRLLSGLAISGSMLDVVVKVPTYHPAAEAPAKPLSREEIIGGMTVTLRAV